VDNDGGKFTGGWEQGKRHGYGKQSWADGRTYDGFWEVNKRHGKGNYVKPNGEVYDGEWQRHKRHGQGSQSYASGSTYAGEWAEDVKCGWGKFTWEDGSSYEGEWAEDKMCGRGTFTEANKRSFMGEYYRGKFVCRLESLGHVGPVRGGGTPGLSTDEGAVQGGFTEEEKAAAATKIQNLARKKKSKKRVERRRKTKEIEAGLATREWSEEEQKAAAKIQAGERGKKIRKKGKAPKWARSERYTCGEMVLTLRGDEAFTQGDFKIKLASKNRGGQWEKHDSGDIALVTPKQGTGLVVLDLSAAGEFTIAGSNEAEWLVVS